MDITEAEIFKRMVLPHVSLILRMYVRILGEEESQDALQDTLLRLWEHRSSLLEAQNIKAYCLATARNVAYNRIRDRHPAEPIDDQVAEATVTTDYASADNLHYAEELMKNLPQQQQQAIRLRSYCDMEIDEIAASMKISEANVRQLLSRGRRRLRQLFKEDTL